MSLNKNLKNKHIDEIFEFFKQDNLVANYTNGITEIECKTANLDNIRIKKIRLLLENSTIEVYFTSGAYYWTIESSGYNEKLYYDVKNILTQKHKELSNLTIDEWEEIYDYCSYVARKNKADNSFLSKELEKKTNCNCKGEPICSKCVEPQEFSFNELIKKMNKEDWGKDEPILPEGFFQSMIDNYSDNDEHSDGSVEEAYEQAEKEFKGMFITQSEWSKSEPIPFKTHYRRKSDEKHFVFICSEIGKIQMKGRTFEKEVVEKNVGSVMMYGLMSFDISKEIVVVDENQLQEEYERLN